MYMLGNHVILNLMEEGGAVSNALSAGLGLQLNLPEALASQSTIAVWEWFNATIWPWLGVLWGVSIIWYSAKTIAESDGQAARVIAPHVVLLAFSTAWIIGLITIPGFGGH